MIQSLLLHGYYQNESLFVIGMLAVIALIGAASVVAKYNNALKSRQAIELLFSLVILTTVWGVSTHWSNLTVTDGWRVLTDNDDITHRLIQRNSTQLSMSGESPFARG